MAHRSTLARLSKLVAADIAAGQAGPDSLLAFQFLEAEPEALLDLLDMLLVEGRKKRPNERLITAYALLIGQSLEFARYAIEGAQAGAAGIVDAVRQRLLASAKEGQVEPALVLLILREFAKAKLDVGPELRDLMESLAEQAAPNAPGDELLKTLDAHLGDLIRDAGGNPFELYAQFGEMAEAFPDNHRAVIGASLLHSGEEAAREAALGWLLDSSASVRNSTASEIERAAASGGVSGVMLRRMIALRNWLPEADRMSLDRAIQTCRRKGVQISPWPEPQVREVIASGPDGAGAQSIFILAREGRRNAVASLLLKHGVGIRDAWARHGLIRAELDDFLGQVQGIGPLPISLDFARIAAAHALAVNLTSEVMPPFAMLDVMETAGLQAIQPTLLSTDAVLGLLEAGADPALSQAAVAEKILASSRDLPNELPLLDSWFELDSDVEQLLAGRQVTRATQVALVQDELLPRRVAKWVDRLAWTALMLRHAEEDEPWEACFVSARELKAGRRIAEIPLMAHVANLTVEAYAANRPERRRSAGRKRR